MRFVRMACWTLLAAAAARIGAAQAGERAAERLSLAQAEQIALANNPTLAQFRARVRAARGRMVQAGLYPNPAAGYVAEEMGDGGAAGQQGAVISQEFVTAGKLRLSRQAAYQEVVRAEAELAAQQRRVLTDVRVAFWRVLIAQRVAALSESLLEIAEQGVQAAEALVGAAEASRVDLLQARVEANKARMLLQTSRQRSERAWRELTSVLGLPELAPQPLEGDPAQLGEPLRWEHLLSRIMAESPELAAAVAEVEAARWTAQRARVEWVPNVGLEAALQHDNASGADIAGVQVVLPLPLFNRNQGTILAANSELTAAQRNVDRLRLSLRGRLADAFQRYAAARQEVETYREQVLPDAKETLELVGTGHRQGEFSYLQLLTAQRTCFENSLAYLDSLLRLRRARAELEGLLLSGSLSGGAAGGRP